jgi:CubicO group peptidase (beta-lactamase class C family)
VFSKAYGYANVASKTPDQSTTKYLVASLTKQFTAAAILLLESEGKLTLDVPVKTYWPQAPSAWDKVTVFHLLTHTSGLPDITDSPEYPRWIREMTAGKDILEYYRDKPLEFEPGSKFSYSNTGYILLSTLMERISGRSYGVSSARTFLRR